MTTGQPFQLDPDNPQLFAWVADAVGFHYVEGYREAICILVDHVEEGGPGDTAGDRLAFPIAFLCRHLIELRLKELIDAGNRLLDMNENPLGHKLNELWQSCRRVILKAWPNTPESDFQFVDELVVSH